MSDTFVPGDDWTEGWVPDDATGTYEWFELYRQEYTHAGASGRAGSFVTRWHRRLVDPLPTQTFTVICVTWRRPLRESLGEHGVLTLLEDGTWSGRRPEHIRESITGYRVVAKPTGVEE